MNIMKIKNKVKRGITLIEAAMVLAVGAIVIAGVIALLNGAFSGNKLNKATGQVVIAVTNAKQLYAASTTYSGLGNTSMYSSMPRDMQGTSPTLTNAFGGALNFGIGASTAQGQATFVDVPQDVCVKFATGDFGRDVVDVGVAAQTAIATAPTVTFPGASVMTNSRPDATKANTNCSGEYNTVVFRFGK